MNVISPKRTCRVARITLCLSLLLTGLALASPVTAAPINILWITCEDMSPRLGCYGDHTVPTPNLDRLASQGVRYTNFYGTYGVCAPNRHTIITGMYPNSTGGMAMRTWKRTSALHLISDPELLSIPTYEATPPAGVKCFPEYLRAAGYYCTNNVKTDYQFRPPLTAWDDSSNQAHWRNRPTPETPFFAVINIITPHESGTFKQRSPQVTDPAKVALPPYYPDTPLVRRDVARHYDNIAAMDGEVGQILTQLEEDGLADNTLVFFYSDHGDGLPRSKRWVYDSGIRAALLIRFPQSAIAGSQPAGSVSDELISFVDLAPTMLSVTGLPLPAYMQGQAFLGQHRAEPRKYIYASRDRMDPAPETIRAVRDHRYKYVRNYRPDLPYLGYIPYRDQAEIMQEIHRAIQAGQLGPDAWQLWSKHKPLEELYDTQTDPHEIHNLASNPQNFEKLAELRQAHQQWTKDINDLGHLPESELIKKLWPPDGIQPQVAPVQPQWQQENGRRQLTLATKTEGASIAYRLNDEDRWRLYTQPVAIEKDVNTITAQAFRIGWKPSKPAQFSAE